jgi:hypothetical protein
MNRHALVHAAPANNQLHAMTQAGRKQAAETFVESILDAIAAEGRSPDDWEAHDLLAAIGFIVTRFYFAAFAYADRAMTPIDQRSLAHTTWTGPAPTENDLRQQLQFARIQDATAD